MEVYKFLPVDECQRCYICGFPHILCCTSELIIYEMAESQERWKLYPKREILSLTDDLYLVIKIYNVKHYITVIFSDHLFRCICKHVGYNALCVCACFLFNIFIYLLQLYRCPYFPPCLLPPSPCPTPGLRHIIVCVRGL